MSRKIGIVRFLGTNCDRDVWEAVKLCGGEPVWMWYEDQADSSHFDGVIIPGGFSYGDYLRCGALAAKSPVMKSVRELAEKGVPVLGICNGFQILCETQLLPGTLLRNKNLKFIDKWTGLKAYSGSGVWKGDGLEGEFELPIAHGEGCYYIAEEGAKNLFEKDQVWLTYTENPNGSISDIAGVLNSSGNVAGLMPHPERAMTDWMGGEQGRTFIARLCS